MTCLLSTINNPFATDRISTITIAIASASACASTSVRARVQACTEACAQTCTRLRDIAHDLVSRLALYGVSRMKLLEEAERHAAPSKKHPIEALDRTFDGASIRWSIRWSTPQLVPFAAESFDRTDRQLLGNAALGRHAPLFPSWTVAVVPLEGFTAIVWRSDHLKIHVAAGVTLAGQALGIGSGRVQLVVLRTVPGWSIDGLTQY